MISAVRRFAFLLAPTVLLAASVSAQVETEGPVWKNEAELSFVATDGNSETSSLGFGAKFERTSDGDRFEASLGGVRAESTDTTRSAVLFGDSVTVVEDSDTELTAENYHAKARFDRDFGDDWFWHVGGSWERDEFAGIDQRLQAVAGVGHKLRDTDDQTWRIDTGVTWTGEQLTVGGDEDFLGLRLSSDWSRQVTETTKLAHTLQLDQNLDETDDTRVDTKLSVQVAMTQRLAIKAALQAKYDAEPALEELAVVDENGNATGTTILQPLDETDLKATVSLVVNF